MFYFILPALSKEGKHSQHSQVAQMTSAVPIKFSRGTNPQIQESEELALLSPMTK